MGSTFNIEFSWHEAEEINGVECLLNLVARLTLERCSVPDASASLVITDDETVKELNMTHRGLDEVTDVLSFSNIFEGQYYGDPEDLKSSESDFVLPPDQEETIGEVVISLPQAIRQAKLEGNNLRMELSKLVAHGFLHLLGYDHMETQDRKVMEELEADILIKVGKDV